MLSLPRAVHILIGLALVSGLCALLALQIYPFWQQFQKGWVPDVAVKQITPSNDQREYTVAEFNLFGEENAAPRVVEETPKDLPETRLRLTLTGVLAGRKEELAGALIEGPDRSTDYYKIGDSLPGNAELHKIYPDRVVVKRSGRLENLYFPESSAPMQAVQTFDNAPANPEQAARPAPRPTPTANPNTLSEERRQSIKDRLSNLRQRIINNRN